ncbi:MAG: hypothetical protein JRI23_14770 [Deltaproteobacteria bacterium]|jgi:hypothetical protein|nr:hypothetical protein [Deltaproteobacteria bacterium]MBW2533012.1 hypothetical protein [Deltaproteobacteria bacterium]
MPKKAKTIAKSAAVTKKIDTALGALGAALTDSNKAVVARTRTNKKLTAELKKLNRQRRVLAKRKVTAAAKAKKAPNALNRRALKAVEKDLVATRKALVKARADKAGNAAELKALKAALRQSTAYSKAIAQADKALNKPTRRRKVRRRKA